MFETINAILTPTPAQATAILGALAVGIAYAAIEIWNGSQRRRDFHAIEQANAQRALAARVQSEIRARASY